MVAKMAKIGIAPGEEYDASKLPASVAERIPKAGPGQDYGPLQTGGSDTNGWIFTTKAGVYGTNYLQRAPSRRSG